MGLAFFPRALLCLACVDAARLQVQEGSEAVAKGKFGPSCETLQNRFRMRSKHLQDFINSHSGADDMSLAERARAVMKVSAVLRPLRRGSDCSWVVVGTNDDIEAVGKVVRSLLATNPCAPAAIAELQLLDKDGEESAALLARAMSILMSDTCEYEDQGQEPNDSDEIADLEDIEIEELVQDGVEEMMETEGARSSLVEQPEMQPETQRKRSWAYVGKLLGAIMFGVLFSLGCAWAGGWIVGIVGCLFGMLLFEIGLWMGNPWIRPGQHGLGWWTFFYSGVIGASTGIVGGAALCGSEWYRIVSNLMLDQ